MCIIPAAKTSRFRSAVRLVSKQHATCLAVELDLRLQCLICCTYGELKDTHKVCIQHGVAVHKEVAGSCRISSFPVQCCKPCVGFWRSLVAVSPWRVQRVLCRLPKLLLLKPVTATTATSSRECRLMMTVRRESAPLPPLQYLLPWHGPGPQLRTRYLPPHAKHCDRAGRRGVPYFVRHHVIPQHRVTFHAVPGLRVLNTDLEWLIYKESTNSC